MSTKKIPYIIIIINSDSFVFVGILCVASDISNITGQRNLSVSISIKKVVNVVYNGYIDVLARYNLSVFF